MAKRSRKRLLRSPAVLVVALVTVLGLSGLAYAFWFTTLTIEGNVNTGNVGMSWQDAWTDDDGWVRDWDTNDNGDGSTFDWWDQDSSGDPEGPFADRDSDRRTKDVGMCQADGGGDHLNVWIDNAYPSYWCTVSATAQNEGSIPVRATAFGLTAQTGFWDCTLFYNEALNDPDGGLDVRWDNGEYLEVGGVENVFDDEDIRIEHDNDGPYLDADDDNVFSDGDTRLYAQCNFNGSAIEVWPEGNEGSFAMGTHPTAEITGDIVAGIRCGTQVDPGQAFGLEGWLHVEEEATQGTQYMWTMTQRFVNWNEFSYLQCTEGAVAADANGTRIGIVDYGESDGVLYD